ncbi:MAG: hypothetical protein LBR69_02345 [Endomicrobium sp.]|jgi:hypothetical protein|nr:hypothetical protein [Endomicrobium sp.]
MNKSIVLALFLTAALFFLNACDKAQQVINPYTGWDIAVTQLEPAANPVSVNVSSIIFAANVINAKGEDKTTEVQSLIAWGASVVSVTGVTTPVNDKITFLLSGSRVSIGTGFRPQQGDQLIVAAGYAGMVARSTVTFIN